MPNLPRDEKVKMTSYSSAVFSSDRRYRYLLRRRVSDVDRICLFVLLNPSTADETTDDPTIRRCAGFAKRWGFGWLLVVNLFALRSTDPRELYNSKDPVGLYNNAHIRRASLQAQMTIAAWGIHGALCGRDAHVLSLLDSPMHLGLTKGGHPRHPLYLPNGTIPSRFSGEEMKV